MDPQRRNDILEEALDRAGLSFVDTPSAAAVTTSIEPGERIGRSVVRRLIGRGGMSCVYEAGDSVIGGTVAVKVPAGTIDATETQRFFSKIAGCSAACSTRGRLTSADRREPS